ncbi:hypothetical protein CDAR_44761 [Caerostris darwini]|uniref:Uncharacterized protein n=1 Tax=Caerostris darwini TaxID=1538125 RepID=A0AAV4SRG0_9ARAC|nr:hypothetical protein CDAR_44761 [Caerostris darwini]
MSAGKCLDFKTGKHSLNPNELHERQKSNPTHHNKSEPRRHHNSRGAGTTYAARISLHPGNSSTPETDKSPPHPEHTHTQKRNSPINKKKVVCHFCWGCFYLAGQRP